VAVFLAVAASAAVAEPAAAGLTVSCVGSAADVTVPFDLFVPAGESCDLTNVVIQGSATVRAGADLLLSNSTVDGALMVQSNGFASVTGSTITGATRLSAAFGAVVDGGSRAANVTATGAGFLFGLGSSFGAVTSTQGETVLETARLSKSLSTTGDVLTDVSNSVVAGGVTVRDATRGSVVCLSEIDGDAQFSGATDPTGVVQIGASAPLNGCGFNVFGADLTVAGNTAPSFIADNVIRGALSCTGNDPTPTVSGGRIRGGANGQCAGASVTRPSTVVSGAPDRSAGLRQAVTDRRGAGESAAAAAGPADLG